MKKNILTLIATLISVLIMSSCASYEKNSSEPADVTSSVTESKTIGTTSRPETTSSVTESEAEQKTNADVKADTDKEFARYRELYPTGDIVDKITPVIKESESTNKGHTNYTIDFFDAYSAALTIELPKKFSVRLYKEGERLYASLRDMGVQPFYSSAVGICDKEDNVIGGISSSTIMYPDDLISGADCGRIVYQGLFTGMGNTWDLGYKQISLADTECTATTYICYPDYGIKDKYPRDYARMNNMPDLGGERYFLNKAVLSYNADKLKYVAVEIDFDCITDEELLSVAESVKLS